MLPEFLSRRKQVHKCHQHEPEGGDHQHALPRSPVPVDRPGRTRRIGAILELFSGVAAVQQLAGVEEEVVLHRASGVDDHLLLADASQTYALY